MLRTPSRSVENSFNESSNDGGHVQMACGLVAMFHVVFGLSGVGKILRFIETLVEAETSDYRPGGIFYQRSCNDESHARSPQCSSTGVETGHGGRIGEGHSPSSLG